MPVYKAWLERDVHICLLFHIEGCAILGCKAKLHDQADDPSSALRWLWDPGSLNTRQNPGIKIWNNQSLMTVSSNSIPLSCPPGPRPSGIGLIFRRSKSMPESPNCLGCLVSIYFKGCKLRPFDSMPYTTARHWCQSPLYYREQLGFCSEYRKNGGSMWYEDWKLRVLDIDKYKTSWANSTVARPSNLLDQLANWIEVQIQD